MPAFPVRSVPNRTNLSGRLAVSGAIGASINSSAPAESTPFIRVVDTAADGATWVQSNHALPTLWNNAGGDWRDAQESSQGGAPYATFSVTTAAVPQTKQINVTALVQKLVTGGNTGIIIRKTAGPAVNFASRANPSGSQPQLQVVTTTGTFNCPLLSTIWVDASSSNPIQSSSRGYVTSSPTLMRFYMGSVTGTVVSAFLTLTVTTVFAGTLPAVFEVNRIDATPIYDDPATQIGGLRQGIAATVDTSDLDLASHPSVIQYNSLESDALIDAGYMAVPPIAQGGHTFLDWPEYGIKAIQCFFNSTNQRAVWWMKFFQPLSALPTALQNAPWRKPYTFDQPLGYDELYARFMLSPGSDIKDGMDELGIKLPGFEGTYEFSTSGSVTDPQPPGDGKWSYWVWHGQKSVEHPDVYRLATYSYDVDHSYTQFPSNGDIRYTNLYPILLRAGRKYCIEQRIKLNTISGNSPNADGIYELYVDGVLVHYDSALRIRGYNAAQIHAFRMLLYHGGVKFPIGNFHYDLAAAVIATEYIGPPKLVDVPTPVINGQATIVRDGSGNVPDSWWAGLPKNQWIEVLDTDPVSHVSPLLPSGYRDRGVGFGSGWQSWIGAAIDKTTGRMWFRIGGHADSANNGLYEFNLEKMTWRVAMTPSAYTDAECNEAYAAYQASGQGALWPSPFRPVGWNLGYWPPISQWKKNTAYALGEKRRQLANVTSERVFQVTTAGTSHATTEPTWNAGGVGTTTSDGSVVWTEIAGTPSPIGGTGYWKDLKPTANHTYRTIAWCSNLNVVITARSGMHYIKPSDGTFFNSVSRPPQLNSDNSAVFDPVTGQFYLFYALDGEYWGFHKWAPATDTWGAKINTAGGNRQTQQLIPIIVGREIICYQDFMLGISSALAWRINLDTGAQADITLANHPVRQQVNATTWRNHTASGMGDYSPTLGKLYFGQRKGVSEGAGGDGSGKWGRFTVVDATTFQCTEYEPTGTPPALPNTTTSGYPYSKFRIYERTNGTIFMVMFNQATFNLRLVRLR